MGACQPAQFESGLHEPLDLAVLLAARPVGPPRGGCARVTLLELVDAASDFLDSEEKVVDCVRGILEDGLAELAGNFRGVPLDAMLGRRAPVER